LIEQLTDKTETAKWYAAAMKGYREAAETLMLMPSTTSGGGMKAVRARPRTMQKRLGGFAKLRSMEALLL
jgi:hypothetical protein